MMATKELMSYIMSLHDRTTEREEEESGEYMKNIKALKTGRKKEKRGQDNKTIHNHHLQVYRH